MCEFLRRGWDKKSKMVEINDRSQKLREQNRREHGEKMLGGELRTAGHGGGQILVERADGAINKPPEYDCTQLRVNPDAQNPPCGFSVVEFTALEKKAQSIQEATDDWVSAAEPIPERVWKTAPLTSRQISIEEWWGDKHRPFEGSLGTYIRNLMGKTEGGDWLSSFELAMDHIIAECIDQDRQDVLAYRLSRVSTGGGC